MLDRMILLGLIILCVGLVLWLAPTGLRPPARTIGICLAVLGGLLMAIDLLDLTGADVDDAD